MSFPHRWLPEYRGYTGGAAASHSPPPGCCQSLVLYQDRYLILFGGGSLRCFSNEVYVFDLDRHTWTRRQPENSDIVAPRLGHTAVVYKDAMIVYGGQNLHSPVIYDDVLRLDLVAWRWSLLQRAPPFPDGPGARRLHCAHVVGDCMYALLGSPGQTGEAPVWSLDLITGLWRNVGPASTATTDTATINEAGMLVLRDVPPPLCGCCSALCGDHVYVFGGFLAATVGLVDDTQLPLSYTQRLYAFNVRCSTWRLVRPASPFPRPPRRYAASMAVHGGYVYIFGGDANERMLSCYYNDVWRLQVSSPRASWELVSVAGRGPSPRTGSAYACARSSLYVVGGETSPFTLSDEGTYSSEMFALPLGFSCALTLRDNAARWLGMRARQNHTRFSTDVMAGAWVRLSLGARQALQPYTQY